MELPRSGEVSSAASEGGGGLEPCILENDFFEGKEVNFGLVCFSVYRCNFRGRFEGIEDKKICYQGF